MGIYYWLLLYGVLYAESCRTITLTLKCEVQGHLFSNLYISEMSRVRSCCHWPCTTSLIWGVQLQNSNYAPVHFLEERCFISGVSCRCVYICYRINLILLHCTVYIVLQQWPSLWRWYFPEITAAWCFLARVFISNSTELSEGTVLNIVVKILFPLGTSVMYIIEAFSLNIGFPEGTRLQLRPTLSRRVYSYLGEQLDI